MILLQTAEEWHESEYHNIADVDNQSFMRIVKAIQADAIRVCIHEFNHTSPIEALRAMHKQVEELEKI